MKRGSARFGSWVPLALLSGLVGCFGEIKFPEPAPVLPRPGDLPAVRLTFVHEIVTRQKVGGVKLRVYDTGALTARGGAVSSLKSWEHRVRLSAPAFLIRHPTQGLILFDTGFSSAREGKLKKPLILNEQLAPLEMKKGQGLAAQLKADGVEPSEIRWIILSQFGPYHAGALSEFPEATIIADCGAWDLQKAALKADYDAAQANPAVLERERQVRLVELSTAPAYGAFDRGADLFDDGTLILLDLSGRVAAGRGLWVNLDEGPVLLAGAAAWVIDNYQDLAPIARRHIKDEKLYWRRVHQIRVMQEAVPRLVVLPAHDPVPLKLQPRNDATLVAPPR